MRRRRSSLASQKRKRAGRIILGVILLIGISVVSVPYFLHIKDYRSAIERYDFQSLAEELAWIEANAGILKKLPLIQEGEIWLKLNTGKYDDLEKELVQAKKDKGRFWLFQLYLLKDNLPEAAKVIVSLESQALKKCAEGLLLAHQGEHQKAVDTLFAVNASDLSREERVLMNTILARSLMAIGDTEKSQQTWLMASQLSPQHPLVVKSEFDLALAAGQWGRAKELSQHLEGKGVINDEELMVKKALLALVVGDRESYQNSLTALEGTANGEACRQYLLGIEVYERGEFQKAAGYWQGALDLGLPGFVKEDASIALAQAKERVSAEPALAKARGGN